MTPIADIDYVFQHVDDDFRIAAVEAQIPQFEQAIFGHQLNMTRLLALPTDTKADVARELDSIATLRSAIQTNIAVLADLRKKAKKK